jgi:putative ABC transport system permease protein
MNVVAETQAAQHPSTNSGTGIRVTPLRDEMIGNLRTVALLLAGAAMLVALVAAANVANLTAARTLSRHRDTTIRTALGASRNQLITDFLAEGLALALAGTVAAIPLAYLALEAVIASMPSLTLLEGALYLRRVSINASLVLFTVTAALLSIAPSAIIMASQTSRRSLNEMLQAGRAYTAPRNWAKLRPVLVAFEITFALILLAGAGLMTRSILRLLETDLGFKPENVVSMAVSLPLQQYRDESSITAFYSELQRRVEVLPGVASAGIVDELPLTKDTGSVRLYVDGRPRTPEQELDAVIRSASPRYFETMGIVVKSGRPFVPADDALRPGVMILNQTLADFFFPGENPVGRRVALALNGRTFDVVGVVSDVRMGEVDRNVMPAVYVSSLQSPSRSSNLVIRTIGPIAGELATTVRQEVQSLDAEIPVYRIRTMQEVLESTRSFSSRRIVLYPIAAFGALSIAIAALGLYGLLDYMVASQTREIGIRMALGARQSNVLRSTIGQGLKLAAAGVVAGLAVSFALTRLLSTFLYHTEPLDAITLAAVSGLVFIAAIAACVIPALRAARIDPIIALRQD